MLLGSYSVPHLMAMYKYPEQRSKIRQYTWLIIVAFLIWIAVLFLLFYYWPRLELWARVLAVIGLFFNVGGAIFSLLVIYLVMMPSDQVDVMPFTPVPSIQSTPQIAQPAPAQPVSLPKVISKPIENDYDIPF